MRFALNDGKMKTNYQEIKQTIERGSASAGNGSTSDSVVINLQGLFVLGGRKMKVERIIKIKHVAVHCYDGTQCEKAIYAKSDRRKGYRWYIGYGADYMPASINDLDNMTPYTYQAEELDAAQRLIGKVVRMYRSE